MQSLELTDLYSDSNATYEMSFLIYQDEEEQPVIADLLHW